MADFPTITYTNLKHKVSNGISGGVIQTKDEAINIVFNNGIGIASAYKASFNSPHNQITGTLKSNKELTKWEARVTPAEVEDYGPTVGNSATLITGISANTSTNFTIPITREVFAGSPSNTYRICLMGQSSLDYSWDCTQFYMAIEPDKSFSDDYTEVDYIYQNQLHDSGTTGLAYIQSNLSFADIDTAEFDIAISDVGGTSNNIVLCAYNTSFYIIVDKNTHSVHGFSRSAWEPSSLTTFSDGQRHKVKVSGLSSSNTTKVRTAWDWVWWRETKWYGLKLYKNNAVIQDLVPCIRDSDNKPGMYDKVSNKFFPGQGSGEFKYGPLKSVPKTYHQIDYIEADGTQYINTNFVASANTRVQLQVLFNTLSNQGLYGGQGQDNDTSLRVFTSGSSLYVSHGGNRVQQNHSLSAYNIYTIDHTHTKFLVNNDTNYKTSSGTSYQHTPLTICRCNGFSGTVYTFSGRLYYCKIWDNNILKRDLIPCVRNSDNKLGMFDLVNNVFYTNAGTGEFQRGPLRTVPKIYQRVEYIQNTGQQHIDTLVNGNNVNLKICTEYEPTNSGQMAIFSARTSTSNGISFWTDGYCHFGNSSARVPGVNSTGKHKVELSKNGLYLDGAKLNFTAGTSMANANLILFRVLNDNRVFLGKIYGTKVYDDNILIRDLVPCYRKSDNVIGMFDLVNNVFYTNAGSGTFLKGNNASNNNYIKYKPKDADGYDVHFIN